SGYVNNLNLRVGSYLADGQNAVVLLDGHSFWVEAYFQETKLPLVKPGDKAAIKLMAYESPIQGTVISISKAIANPNNDPGFLGLQQTDPVDAWVRLAQRIPVYVRIDEVPEGVMIAAGMTASVAVGEAAKDVEQPDN